MTLLQSEIPSAASLKPYLDVIGGGANRVSEIAGRLGVPATALSRPLARLVELGLIRREVPFGESERNSKKSLYRLADPFCKFWFGVVASRRSVFARASGNVRKSIWRSVSEQVFAAEWEELRRLIGGLLDRTSPPGLPEDAVRVLFVASAESGPGILNGVRVYTAEQIIGK